MNWGRYITVPVLLALFYIVLMTPLMGRKNGYTVDATPSYQLTKTIVSVGDWFPDQLRVKQGYIYSILYIPFYGLGEMIASWNPGVEADWIRRKCLCWMNTVITGCTIAVLSLVIRRMKFSRIAQIGIPLIYGCSTMAFNYARYDYNKPLAGFLLLLAFYYLITGMEKRQTIYAWGTGIALGLLLTIRLEMGVVLPAFLLGWILLSGSIIDRLRRGAALLFPCILGIAWVLIYNRMYWSGEVSGGYEGGFSINPFPGLIGFLFSPGKNIWVFNPVFFLLPVTLRLFRNQRVDLFPYWLGIVLPIFGLYCFWWNWWGGWGWGPRHLVPLLPFLMLPLTVIVDCGSREYKIALGGLFLLGMIVQFLGSIIDFNDVILALMRSEVTEPELIWNPVWNAVVQHTLFFENIEVLRWDWGWMGMISSLSLTTVLAMLMLWVGILVALGYGIYQASKMPSLTVIRID